MIKKRCAYLTIHHFEATYTFSSFNHPSLHSVTSLWGYPIYQGWACSCPSFHKEAPPWTPQVSSTQGENEIEGHASTIVEGWKITLCSENKTSRNDSEWMILFHQLHFLFGRSKKWGILLHKNLAILVPFSMLDAKKSQKKQDLTWRESPKILAIWFPWKSQRFCEILGVSRYPGIPASTGWRFPKNVSWIDFV